jgi:hypothetical protein
MQNPFLFSRFRATSLFLHDALQGMLVLARKIHHLRHLGLGDFVGEHPALSDSVVMDVEHYLGRGFDILLEEFLQDMNDKFHRGVIVVQYQDPIEIRALCLRLDLGDNGCGRTAGPPGAIFVIAHSGSSDGGWRARIISEGQLQHGTGVRNPLGKPDSDQAMFSWRSHRKSSGHVLQIAAPGRPDCIGCIG